MAETSRAEAYLLQKAWEFKHSGDQLVVYECPFCNNQNHKFYINKTTGLWDCKVCGESGNLYKLMTELGDRTEGIMSTREAANATVRPGKLPDVEAAHERLLENEEALEYLVGIRGFTMDVITQQKLGLHEIGGSPYIVIPYFSKGNLIYAKFRSIPPAKKSFLGIANREVPLYNEDAIHKGMEELICVEGEPDTLACLSAGIKGVVGIPGANIKKATWIDLIDEAQPSNIYILYDNDSVGQKAAREMAARIGLDKVKNILLPPFQTFEGAPGKDINEWFRAGHTLEEFEELKKSARKFDVTGVNSLTDVLEELGQELANKDILKPKYDTPWPSLNRRLGGAEDGDRIDIVAEAKSGKTTAALNWADYIVEKYEDNAMVYCLEMTRVRLARKWVSHVTQTDDSPAISDEDGKERLLTMRSAVEKAKEIARNRKADLLFAHTTVNEPQDVYDTIRQAVRRYGVKFVVFDNLQLLADKTLKNAANRTVHLSQISKNLKALAVELGIVLVCIVQPNRVKENEIVDARNVDGSSQIEKDCDALVAFHRPRKASVKASDFEAMKYLECDDTFEPQMLVKVALSRYAGGGICTLWMHGATSTVSECPSESSVSQGQQTGPELPVEEA